MVRKVLYVEDDPAQRELMTQLLMLEGVEVKLAKNGAEGMTMAQTWQPDIILMDLRMPQMDGFESIQQIKEHGATSDIPVVVVSAWTSAAHDERALALGADSILSKPFGLTDIVALINRYKTRA